MPDDKTVIDEETGKPVDQNVQQVFGGQANTQGYIDEQFYIRDLLRTYLDRIEGDTQEIVDRERAKFVTFSRGIIGDIQAENPDAKITRSGEHTFKYVFDLAWEALYPEPAKPKEEPPVEEPPVEPPVKEPTGTTPPPVRRAAGDIKPVEDGDELENYVEKLGLKQYTDLRMELRQKTKTINNSGNNQAWIRDRVGIPGT
jgi:hypothetical protein